MNHHRHIIVTQGNRVYLRVHFWCSKDLDKDMIKCIYHYSIKWPKNPLNSYACLVIVELLSLTLCNPWTVALQAPLSMGFSRQEYWGWLPFPSPGDLPNPEIEPGSPALASRFFNV